MIMFISRKQYESQIAAFEQRIKDLERHFVTKRDENGAVVETLADVPIAKRKDLKERVMPSQKGLTWMQRRALLEVTDGGRKL